MANDYDVDNGKILKILEDVKWSEETSYFSGVLHYDKSQLDQLEYPCSDKADAISRIKRKALDKYFEVKLNENGAYEPDYQHISQPYVRTVGGQKRATSGDIKKRVLVFCYYCYIVVLLLLLFFKQFAYNQAERCYLSS